jgi:VanZ family protein
MKLSILNLKRAFWGYSVILIFLSTLPINGLTPGNPLNNIYVVSLRLDYLLHFAIFIPWVFLLSKVSLLYVKKTPLAMLLLISGSILFACALEGVQYFLPYRGYNINDLIANGLGVVIGVIIFFPGIYSGHAVTSKM